MKIRIDVTTQENVNSFDAIKNDLYQTLPKDVEINLINIAGPAGGNPEVELVGDEDLIYDWLISQGYGEDRNEIDEVFSPTK